MRHIVAKYWEPMADKNGIRLEVSVWEATPDDLPGRLIGNRIISVDFLPTGQLPTHTTIQKFIDLAALDIETHERDFGHVSSRA